MRDDTSGWSRRFFLVGGAAAATIASFYISAIARGALKACSYEVEGGLSSELQSLIRIGNSYLNEHTKNGEPDTLDEALFSEIGDGGWQYRLCFPTSPVGDRSSGPR